MDGSGIMKTGEVTIQVLEADEGMILTDGETFSTLLYLGINDYPERWEEITIEEAIERGYEPEPVLEEESSMEVVI